MRRRPLRSGLLYQGTGEQNGVGLGNQIAALDSDQIRIAGAGADKPDFC
jgi:hypothetical protein